MVRVAHRRWQRRDDATPILYHCSHVQSLFRSFLPDSIRLLDLEVVEYFAACTASCARLARTSIDRYCCVEQESWRGLGARRVKFSWNFSDILGKFPSVRRQLFVSQTKLAGRDSSSVERTTTSFHLATNSPSLIALQNWISRLWLEEISVRLFPWIRGIAARCRTLTCFNEISPIEIPIFQVSCLNDATSNTLSR